jgi:hypothetical protein
MWFMQVRDWLSCILEGGSANFVLDLERALHILPFCMTPHKILIIIYIVCTDDLHSLKTVQEAFFRVATVITQDQTIRNDEFELGGPSDANLESSEGQRLAELVARFLPADQICAPYVFFFLILLHYQLIG